MTALVILLWPPRKRLRWTTRTGGALLTAADFQAVPTLHVCGDDIRPHGAAESEWGRLVSEYDKGACPLSCASKSEANIASPCVSCPSFLLSYGAPSTHLCLFDGISLLTS